MGPYSERIIHPRRPWVRRIRTTLIAATLAIGPAVLGWTPPGVPVTARADCCGMLGPIGSLTALGDTLVFTAYDGRHGWELWRSDGTAKGTRLVKDIRPGRKGSGPENFDCQGCEEGSGSLRPIVAGVAGGSLVLWADDGRHGLEPWRSDGTAKGTRLLRDIRPGRKGSGPEGGAAVGDLLYFGTDDGTHPPALWRTDGTAEGTTLVTDFVGISDHPVGAGTLTPVGDGLFFLPSSSDFQDRRELWRSDGTAEGTVLVTTFDPGTGIQDLVAAGGALYFAGQGTDEPDSSLWRSDGTADGTIPIKTPISLGVPFVTAVGETVYFGHTAVIRNEDTSAQDTGWLELWRSDGTAEGTTLVTSSEKKENCCPRFTGAAVLGGTLYLTMELEPPPELWRSDGTPEGTTLVKAFDIRTGGIRPPVAVGDTLYVVNGDELWRSDGTAEGTTLVVDLAPGEGPFIVEGPIVVGDALYFTFDRANRGELWRSDGTPEGTLRLLALARE